MLSRRWVLKWILASIPVMAGGIPKSARAASATLPPPEIPLDKRLSEIVKGKNPVKGKIKLLINPIIEDGSVAPLKIEFDALLSDPDILTTIDLIVDKNPDPLIFTLRPHPEHTAGFFHTRIRMRESSRVAVYASMKSGKVYYEDLDVAVTAGGCG